MRIEDWFLTPRSAATRLHAARLVDRQRRRRRTCTARRTSPAGRRGRPRSSRTTTSTSPTGAATPTSGSAPEGPTVGTLFGDAARRGVVVKGLIWRSHHDELSYSEEQNRQLSDDVSEAGGEVLLDQRVRRAGSHHQKMVVVRRPEPRRARDVAFAGGIDLCHTRRDDAEHRGDPQAVPMAKEYGDHPALARRPAGAARPGRRAARRRVPRAVDRPALARHRQPDLLSQGPAPARRPHPGPAAGAAAGPAGAGPCAVQVLRTYPAIRPKTPYAPRGERSVARGYAKAFRRARRLIYLEDQYMWSPHIARLLADALRANPRAAHHRRSCRGTPTSTAASRCRPTRSGRLEAIEVVQKVAPRPGARVRPGEPRRHAGLRPREGVRRRRRVGLRGQREPQPAVVEPRRRAVVRGARRDARTSGSRATPPASATVPAASPATCG